MGLLNPKYVAFIDETGDYVLHGHDPGYPIFATCALTTTTELYLKTVIPAMSAVKYRFWGHECLVFHGARIRSRKHPFTNLKDEGVRDEFMEAVAQAFGKIEAHLIGAAIHKPRHCAQYIDPGNPFYLSLQFLLERLAMHWSGRLSPAQKLLCVFESRGASEDNITKGWFQKICAGENHRNHVFHFECDFRGKDVNVIGHQFADLAAYTVAKYAETGDEDRLDWRAVKPKLRKSWSGRILGYGLKIFPPG